MSGTIHILSLMFVGVFSTTQYTAHSVLVLQYSIYALCCAAVEINEEPNPEEINIRPLYYHNIATYSLEARAC